MIKRYALAIVVMLAIVMAGCQPAPESAAPTEQEAAPTEPVATPTEEVAAEAEPTELNIAILTDTSLEEPWNTALLAALDRVIAEEPHGLTISYDIAENVADPDAARILRQFLVTGEYAVVIAHAPFVDAVTELRQEYPDVAFLGVGAGWPRGEGNLYFVDVAAYEPAYLCGIIAGMMTESNVLGAVAGYPYPAPNSIVNAFFSGAESVNPEIQRRVTYIESWWDPPKAREAAAAQIAAGADFLYAERFGPFEAAAAAGNVYAFGYLSDQYELSPDVVVTSAVVDFDPYVRYIIDIWWNHVVNGVPYDAPEERVIFYMADGGSHLAPYHSFEEILPEEVRSRVEEVRQTILDRSFEVPFDPEQAVSN
jgi:basic membrane protein A